MALDLPALRALLASIEARQPRRRELIRWLDGNDMNGLECAATAAPPPFPIRIPVWCRPGAGGAR